MLQQQSLIVFQHSHYISPLWLPVREEEKKIYPAPVLFADTSFPSPETRISVTNTNVGKWNRLKWLEQEFLSSINRCSIFPPRPKEAYIFVLRKEADTKKRKRIFLLPGFGWHRNEGIRKRGQEMTRKLLFYEVFFFLSVRRGENKREDLSINKCAAERN